MNLRRCPALESGLLGRVGIDRVGREEAKVAAVSARERGDCNPARGFEIAVLVRKLKSN